MRKMTFAAIACCFSMVVTAQISKGSTFLGGSLGFSSNSNKNENSPNYNSESSNWYISPQFGKAIGENRILGVFANYGRFQNENTDGVGTLEKTEGFTSGGGVFYRRYFPMATRFFLFGESTLGAGFGKDNRRTAGLLRNAADRTNFFLGLTPGLSFAAGRKIYLEAALNSLFNVLYQSSKQKNYAANGTVNETITQKQFSGGINSSGFSNLAIGLRWILPSK